MGAESTNFAKHGLVSEEALELVPTDSSTVPLTSYQVSGNNEQKPRQDNSDSPVGGYRLYKSRFFGMIALVSAPKLDSSNILIFTPKVPLGIVSAMSGTWYGPIANNGKPWPSRLLNGTYLHYSYS